MPIQSPIAPSAATGAAASPAAAASPPLAPRIRMAALTLIVVYPFITLLLYAVFPLTDGWPLWGRTMIVAPLMVLSMMFVIVPFLQRRFGRFIGTGKFSAA